ncbi:hypothetical protein Hanom_Chr14g01271991 [Helianthus anomalus]
MVSPFGMTVASGGVVEKMVVIRVLGFVHLGRFKRNLFDVTCKADPETFRLYVSEFLQALSFKFKNYTLCPLCLQPITGGVLSGFMRKDTACYRLQT